MKLTLSSTLLFILIAILYPTNASNIPDANNQSKPPTATPSPTPLSVEELQNTFKRMDKRFRVNVQVVGDEESSGKLIVTSRPNPSKPGVGPRRTDVFDLGLIKIPEEFIITIINTIFSKDPKVNGENSLEGVIVKQIGNSPNYEVVKDYSYKFGQHTITVPAGFVYDRASIPRVFWLLIDKDSLSNVAPLFHDLLYRNGGKLPQQLVSPYRVFSREETDTLFLELMEKCGVVPWRRMAAYRAVRQFAESSWRKN